MFCRTCRKELNDQAVVCVGCGVPPLAGKAYCQSCGAETNPSATMCISCGVALQTNSLANTLMNNLNTGEQIVASSPPKDPILMGVLSGCCITGLGQIILGQTTKGIAILVGSIVLALVTIGFSALLTIPLAGIDAYLIAKKLKEGKAVKQWEFF